MDFPHRCYQKYLPEQYRRRGAFFPGAQWDRRQAPNGDLGRDPNTPQEMMADMSLEGIDLAFLYPTSALRIGEIREPFFMEHMDVSSRSARGTRPSARPSRAST
jgi:hypothetical protein